MTATSMSISSGVKSTVGELMKLSLINLKAPEIENSVLKQSYFFLDIVTITYDLMN